MRELLIKFLWLFGGTYIIVCMIFEMPSPIKLYCLEFHSETVIGKVTVAYFDYDVYNYGFTYRETEYEGEFNGKGITEEQWDLAGVEGYDITNPIPIDVIFCKYWPSWNQPVIARPSGWRKILFHTFYLLAWIIVLILIYRKLL